MDEPYSSPRALDDEALRVSISRRRKFWLRLIWCSIAGIIIPPLFGLAGTAIGMAGAFGELAQSGESDPQELADDISVSLLSTMWALVFSVISLVVLVIALSRFFSLPKQDPPRSGGAEIRQ